MSTLEDGASTLEDGGSMVEDSVCPTEADEGVVTLEEARRVIRELRDRHRSQSRQLLAWKRRVKAQEDMLSKLARDRSEQLRALSSQLLLFEARLCRKQHDISILLAQRDAIIIKQQRAIKQLQSRLIDAGLECAEETNLDSLNDSDSAVIMEDDDFRHTSEGVTVIRSVSDALDTPLSCKYSSMRRNNGFLRRPEVLETVYSVEEDGDSDQPQSSNQTNQTDSGIEEPSCKTHKGRLKDLYGSFERLDQDQPPEPQNHVTTYNRVMSNHRSVTKPKDVKYKRINKAKSKSLEELRGRLKNWVEKGNKLAISLDQSFN
ncbi:uncharacterized protein LOC128993230 isoform X2 [Macrosteles quadrilineatus]|nr:uncharacterized protein LOC128993230 isoform X2 [Macrosteles quadrilineatus]